MIVVGGGIIGLSCAWRLAQRGVSVIVFDAREMAAEASWAGAGMLAPGGEITGASPLARMCLDSLAQYAGFVEELQEASGINIDYRRCGGIEVAFDHGEAVALEQRAAVQTELGIPSEAVRYGGFVAARFFPDDAVVDPRDVTAALQIACRRAGVRFRAHEPVIAIIGDGAGVRTSSGEYEDEAVLIAAGAWSSGLSARVPETMPVRGHLVAYAPRPGLLDCILRREHTYLVPRRSGLIIAGSSTEHVGFDRALDETTLADIQARAGQLLPALNAMQPTERWNGFRPGIAGDMPVVGRLAGSKIYAATGHYRNGILLAPETARIIVESFLYNEG
jgi:glycine oxidase